jgi:hypothetical protein
MPPPLPAETGDDATLPTGAAHFDERETAHVSHATAIPDLWPEDIAQTTVTAPVTILQQQAQILAEKTGGLVCVSVETATERTQSFLHSFSLIAPRLSNYSLRVFRVKHGVHFYPLEIMTDLDGPNFRAATQEDFVRALAEIFGSAPMRKMISSLIAQSRAAAGSSARK